MVINLRTYLCQQVKGQFKIENIKFQVERESVYMVVGTHKFRPIVKYHMNTTKFRVKREPVYNCLISQDLQLQQKLLVCYLVKN